MPYNPCGKAVDIARRTYTTKARLFRDSDVEVPIRWYRVPREWGALPFPSAINSLDWLSEPLLKTGVGEVPGAARPFKYSGPPAGGPFGDHVCGSAEDHARGAVYDPSADVLYGDNGLPVCCQPDAVTPVTGGIDVGGSADVTVIQPVPSEGGIDIGGSADVTVIQPSPTAGGIDIGGSADVTVIQPGAVDGGIEIGGTADITVEQPGPDTCATYWYFNPATFQTFILYGTAGGVSWSAGPPTNNNLVLNLIDGQWQLQDTVLGSLLTEDWNGQGSRVFTNGPTEVTVSCGLPPP